MLNASPGWGVSQLQLFDDRPPRPHSAELMRVLDGINNSGLGKVWFAGRGIAPSRRGEHIAFHLPGWRNSSTGKPYFTQP